MSTADPATEARRWHAPTVVWTLDRDEPCAHCGRRAPDSAPLCLRCSRLFCGRECLEASRCEHEQGALFGVSSETKVGGSE